MQINTRLYELKPAGPFGNLHAAGPNRKYLTVSYVIRVIV
jgi:hypothetical protein